MKHDKLIKTLGGSTALGRVFNEPPSVVNHWRKNGVPLKHWPRIARLCREREIAVPKEIERHLAGEA